MLCLKHVVVDVDDSVIVVCVIVDVILLVEVIERVSVEVSVLEAQVLVVCVNVASVVVVIVGINVQKPHSLSHCPASGAPYVKKSLQSSKCVQHSLSWVTLKHHSSPLRFILSQVCVVVSSVLVLVVMV